MIVHWSEVQSMPNDVGEPNGRPCEHCGELVAHEHLEIFDVNGQLLNVKRIQTHGLAVRITVDTLKPEQKVIN